MSKVKRHPLVSVGVLTVIVVASTMASLLVLDILDFEGGRPSGAQGARTERTSTLSFCVDTYNLTAAEGDVEAIRSEAKSAVENALAAVESAAPDRIEKIEAEGPRYIDEGCGLEPVLANITSDDWIDGLYVGPAPPSVDAESRSPYYVHWYVVNKTELDERLGNTNRRRFTQESMCAGHVCVPVTGSIYFTVEEMRDREFMNFHMEITVGLREE